MPPSAWNLWNIADCPSPVNRLYLVNGMEAQDLEVRVVEIKGHCPVYRVGDCFRILEGCKLQAERPLCLHALTF